MSDAVVTRDTVKVASGASTMPTESLSLNVTKIVFEYAQQKADGSPGQYQTVREGYDVKANVRM